MNPAFRPKIRKTPIRSWLPIVVRCRLIASFARVIAVEKPMQYSVPLTSLSIVLGMAMIWTPASLSTFEYDSVSSPPIEMRVWIPRRSRFSRTIGVKSHTSSPVCRLARRSAGTTDGSFPWRIFRGLVRDEWRNVPPVRSTVRVLMRVSGSTYSGSGSWPWRMCVSASQPRRRPMTS